jgi:hypothetical protein
MVTFLTYEKTHMDTNHNSVMINTVEELDSIYLDHVDGAMFEGFFYATWFGTNLSNTLSPSGTTNGINAVASASATGKILLIESLYPNVDSQTSQVSNFCYAASLLGASGANCYFGYNVGDPNLYNYDTGTDYMPTSAANLGSPIGSYYSSQNVYMRDFSNGEVLLNPSNSPQTVSLSTGSVTINGFSGLVLVNGGGGDSGGGSAPSPTPIISHPSPTVSGNKGDTANTVFALVVPAALFGLFGIGFISVYKYTPKSKRPRTRKTRRRRR